MVPIIGRMESICSCAFSRSPSTHFRTPPAFPTGRLLGRDLVHDRRLRRLRTRRESQLRSRSKPNDPIEAQKGSERAESHRARATRIFIRRAANDEGGGIATEAEDITHKRMDQSDVPSSRAREPCKDDSSERPRRITAAATDPRRTGSARRLAGPNRQVPAVLRPRRRPIPKPSVEPPGDRPV